MADVKKTAKAQFVQGKPSLFKFDSKAQFKVLSLGEVRTIKRSDDTEAKLTAIRCRPVSPEGFEKCKTGDTYVLPIFQTYVEDIKVGQIGILTTEKGSTGRDSMVFNVIEEQTIDLD